MPNNELVRSIGANVSVMALQGRKTSPQKADHLSLAMGEMVFG